MAMLKIACASLLSEEFLPDSSLAGAGAFKIPSTLCHLRIGSSLQRRRRPSSKDREMEARKQAISIRLNSADLRNLRKLARRMGVRNSDVIRFALRSSLARLGPLLEPEVKGRELIPVFVEAGADMVRYLDLDAARIDAIINEGVGDGGNRVERADIHLLAGTGLPQSYARLRLVGSTGARGTAPLNAQDEDQLLSQTLRRYFYDKYVFDALAQNGTIAEAGGGQLP